MTTITQNNTTLTEDQIWEEYEKFHAFFADAFPGWRESTSEEAFRVENGKLVGTIRTYGDTSGQIVITTGNSR